MKQLRVPGWWLFMRDFVGAISLQPRLDLFFRKPALVGFEPRKCLFWRAGA